MVTESLLKNFTALFAKKIPGLNRKNISAAKAISLQHEYLSSFNELEQKRSNPCSALAEQLYNPKEEVFKATVYYLKRIALAQQEQTTEVKDICRKYIQDSKQTAERKEYLKQCMKDTGIFFEPEE